MKKRTITAINMITLKDWEMIAYLECILLVDDSPLIKSLV